MTHTLAIKTALHLLVARLGGVESAAAVIGRNPGRISDATNRGRPDMLPADQVVALEAVAGEPLVTAAMARGLGFRLMRDGPAAAEPAHIPARLGAVAADLGALMQTLSNSLADGTLDDRERADAIVTADELLRSADALAAAVRRVA